MGSENIGHKDSAIETPLDSKIIFVWISLFLWPKPLKFSSLEFQKLRKCHTAKLQRKSFSLSCSKFSLRQWKISQTISLLSNLPKCTEALSSSWIQRLSMVNTAPRPQAGMIFCISGHESCIQAAMFIRTDAMRSLSTPKSATCRQTKLVVCCRIAKRGIAVITVLRCCSNQFRGYPSVDKFGYHEQAEWYKSTIVVRVV